jgi:hypothetical protein
MPTPVPGICQPLVRADANSRSWYLPAIGPGGCLLPFLVSVSQRSGWMPTPFPGICQSLIARMHLLVICQPLIRVDANSLSWYLSPIGQGGSQLPFLVSASHRSGWMPTPFSGICQPLVRADANSLSWYLPAIIQGGCQLPFLVSVSH